MHHDTFVGYFSRAIGSKILQFTEIQGISRSLFTCSARGGRSSVMRLGVFELFVACCCRRLLETIFAEQESRESFQSQELWQLLFLLVVLDNNTVHCLYAMEIAHIEHC